MKATSEDSSSRAPVSSNQAFENGFQSPTSPIRSRNGAASSNSKRIS